MKTILALLCVVVIGANTRHVDGQSITWMSLEEAQELSKTTPKKILVDVYTHWCGPCKMMMKYTFTHPWIVKYINENYYAVKLNAEGADPITFKGKTFSNPGYKKDKPGRNSTHQLTQAIANVNGRIAYPTIVFIDKNLNVIPPVQGYQKPAQFEPMLKFIAEDKYVGQKWQEYMTSFKSELQ